VLTSREDLIEQLKRHVQEFNSSPNDLYIPLYIRLRELKEHAEAKRENPSLFGAREMKSASDAQVKGQEAKCKGQNARKSAAIKSPTTSGQAGNGNIFAKTTMLYPCRPAYGLRVRSGPHSGVVLCLSGQMSG